MSDYTDTELQALKRAYAAGQVTVSYENRSVTFATGNDLLARIREIERDMGTTARPKAGVAGFSRGLA